MNTPSVTSRSPRKRFDQTFRRQAVELWEAGNKSAVEMGAQLGIKPGRLYAWRDKLKPPVAPPATRATNPEVLALENAALRQEIAHLRQQRDILKKTLGILSEPPSNAFPGLKP